MDSFRMQTSLPDASSSPPTEEVTDDAEISGVTPESFMEMDLNALLIKNKGASYLYRAHEDNIEFVQKGAVLLVDRRLKRQEGDILVVAINGEVLLRRLIKLYHPEKQRSLEALITDREGEPPIFLHSDYAEVHFKGVVRTIIIRCRL